MTRLLRLAAVVLFGVALGGCASQPNMPAAGAAGWRGRSPNTEDTIRFVVIADRTGGHVPGEWEKAIAEINRLQPDLVISVGDIIEGYDDDPQVISRQWQEVEGMISKLDAPYFYCVGNHDVESGNPAEPNKSREVYLRKHAVQGNSYYSFDYKNAHFVVLDSAWIGKDEIFADEQLSWLRQDIAKSQKAQHVFVFYHHPLWENQRYWSSIASILPKGKSTIFNGHTHSAGYRLADGIPTYVMPSTGAQVGDDPAQQHMFAYVALNGKQPRISFVPTGSIKTESYLQAMGQVREMLASNDSAAEIPAGGGSFTLNYKNASNSPLTVDITTTAAGWAIEPASAKVTVPAGGTAQAQFTAKPQDQNAGRPALSERFTLADGTSFSRERMIPVYRSADLGQIATLKVDGNSDEWSNITPLEMKDAGLLFQNAAAWKGVADSSCTVRVARSGDKLAMLIEAKDDQIVMNEQANPWEQDGLEICWDVRPQAQTGMTEGAGQIALTPADSAGAPKKLIWIPAGKQAPAAPASVEAFTKRVDGGYVVELALPISDLGLSGGTLSEDAIRVSVTQDDLDGGEDGSLKRMSMTGTGDFWRGTAGYARFTQK